MIGYLSNIGKRKELNKAKKALNILKEQDLRVLRIFWLSDTFRLSSEYVLQEYNRRNSNIFGKLDFDEMNGSLYNLLMVNCIDSQLFFLVEDDDVNDNWGKVKQINGFKITNLGMEVGKLAFDA